MGVGWVRPRGATSWLNHVHTDCALLRHMAEHNKWSMIIYLDLHKDGLLLGCVFDVITTLRKILSYFKSVALPCSQPSSIKSLSSRRL